MDAQGEQLTARLHDAAARLAEWRQLAGDLQLVDAELLRQRTAELRWRQQAEQAAEELAWLRSLAPRALLLRLFGRSLARTASAAARIDEARRQQAAVDEEMEPLLRARESLATRQAAVDGGAREHDELLAAKEEWLRARRHGAVALLDDLRQRLDVAAANRRAVLTAVGHARDAAGALVAAKDELWKVRKPGAAALGQGGTLGFLRYVGRARPAASVVERAMDRVAALARATQQVRELGLDIPLAESTHAPLALGLASPAAAAVSQQDVAHLLEQVRQTMWTLERADAALRELAGRFAAERAACIEAAQ